MLVRECLQVWPESVVCRVVASLEDTLTHFDSHAPDVVCWDTLLGPPPPIALGVRTLLLAEDACEFANPADQDGSISAIYVRALHRSLNREYELRRLTMQLRNAQGSEKQGRLLLARSSDGIVAVNPERHVLFANPAAGALLALDGEELLLEPFPFPLPDLGDTSQFQVQLPDGRERFVTATTVASVWNAEEAKVLQIQPAKTPGTTEGSTQTRVQEDRLRAIGRLAAGVAHEVNNPLTFVLANLESLRESHRTFRRFVRRLGIRIEQSGGIGADRYQRLTEAVKLEEGFDDAAEMLTDCSKGINRIQDIARSLGTFSRADDDSAELIDVARVVDDACAMVFNQIRYRARLVKRFDPVPLVAGYPGRIAQALVNMLLNAAEAIRGGAYDQHRIVVSTGLRGEELVISVSDTGVGVPKRDRDRIFTPGFTTKAHEGGMGLGLSLCRRVAEEHGGRIDFHAIGERGSRFELILPVKTGLHARENRRESVPISEVPIERARLLIIDDDAMVLSALRRRLRRRFDTITVLGGVEALTRLSEDPEFDAIICDLMMPEVDGKSFYEAIVERFPRLVQRTIFMSGGAFTPRLRKFAASVSNPVLQKPVTREQLESVLAAIQDGEAG